MKRHWTGAELMSNPGELIDAILAGQAAAVMAELALTAKPGERAELRRMNIAKLIEARETIRLTLVRGLRDNGVNVPDDFGALPDADRHLLEAEEAGTA